MCYNDIELYARSIPTILYLIINPIGITREKRELHFDLSKIVHLQSTSETWNDNLHKLLPI